MPQLIVTVKRLNKRRLLPVSFPDRDNIIGEVKEGFSFEGEEVPLHEIPNPVLGKWYKDRDGHFYWAGGVRELREEATTRVSGQPSLREAPALARQASLWFKDLGIENIWNQFSEQGDNVTVAVLDTGYDLTNSDLSEAVIGVSHLDTLSPVQMNDLQSPQMKDIIFHGTFCASILSARNKGEFIIGIAPKSKLLVGKISDDGGLDPTGLEVILKGIDWAIKSGAEIISISFGKFEKELPDEPGYLNKIQFRFDEIIKNKNVLIFASSGDNPPQTVLTRERYPASLNGCVSVGATNSGSLSEVTVISPKTIIHAQGIDVESYILGGVIGKKSGTSMSTPIIAGIAALAVSNLKKKNNGVWNPAELLKKIYDSGTAINVSGKKIINPLALFQQL